MFAILLIAYENLVSQKVDMNNFEAVLTCSSTVKKMCPHRVPKSMPVKFHQIYKNVSHFKYDFLGDIHPIMKTKDQLGRDNLTDNMRSIGSDFEKINVEKVNL